MDAAQDVAEVFSSNDREDDFHGSVDSLCIMGCDAVVFIPECLDKLSGIVFTDYSNHDHADGESFFDEHADEGSHGEPSCVRKGGDQVVEVLHDLANSEQPNVDLDEADDRCEVFEPMGDEDDS